MKLIDLQKQLAIIGTLSVGTVIDLGAAVDKNRTLQQAITAEANDPAGIKVGDTGVPFYARDPATGAFQAIYCTITSGTKLTVERIARSSNNNNAVNFAGAACEVYCSVPPDYLATLATLSGALDLATVQTATSVAVGDAVLAMRSGGIIALAATALGGSSTPADTTAPSVPTNLSTSNVTQTQAQFNWNASTDNSGAAPSYEVSRNGTTWTAVAAGTLNYTFTGLTAASAYTLQVRSVDGSGNKSTAATIGLTTSAATGDTTAPTMAGSVTATSVTQTGLTVNYPAGSDNVGVARYDVSVDTGTANWIANGTNLAYAATGLAAGTIYTLRVRAIDAAGNVSNVLTTTQQTSAAAAVAPGAVTGLTAGTATSTTQPLTWNAPSTGTAPFTYNVEKSPAGAETWTSAATGVTGTSYTVTGLTASTSYDYRVSAVNSAGTGTADTITGKSTAAPMDKDRYTSLRTTKADGSLLDLAFFPTASTQMTAGSPDALGDLTTARIYIKDANGLAPASVRGVWGTSKDTPPVIVDRNNNASNPDWVVEVNQTGNAARHGATTALGYQTTGWVNNPANSGAQYYGLFSVGAYTYGNASPRYLWIYFPDGSARVYDDGKAYASIPAAAMVAP